MFLFEHSKFEHSNCSKMASLFGNTILHGKYHSTLFFHEGLFPRGSHYLLLNKNCGSTNFPENNDWERFYFQGVLKSCVRYIFAKLFFKPKREHLSN